MEEIGHLKKLKKSAIWKSKRKKRTANI